MPAQAPPVTSAPAAGPPTALTSAGAAELAARHGLAPMGVRPSLPAYLRQLWGRRHFVRTLATSKAYARNQGSYLGQLWSLLTPLINAVVYYLIFGGLLDLKGGVDNFPAFLVIGIFLYRFTTSSITAGSRSLLQNTNLLRSLHFPRAVLPASAVLAELATLAPALVVMLAIVLATGERPRWSWLLLAPAIAVQWLWNTGCAFFMARLGARIPDLTNLLPFALRILMYVSGVFFSVDHYTHKLPHWVGNAMVYQPLGVYLSLARSCLLEQFPMDATMWWAGVGWAVLFVVAGFIVFWRAEETYGRD
jgi:teichoic acid transport system permease protein